MNTKLREQIAEILQKYFHAGCDESLPLDEANFVADEIIDLIPSSKSNDNDYLKKWQDDKFPKGGGR